MELYKNNPLLSFLIPVLVIILAFVIIFIGLKSKIDSDIAFPEYVDQEYGFSLTYPQTWAVSSSSNPVQFFETSTISGLRKLQMEIFSTPQTLPLEEYLSSQSASVSGNLSPVTVNHQTAFKEKIQVDGREFLSYYFQNPLSPTMYILTFNSDLIEQTDIIGKIITSLTFKPPLKFSPPTLPPSASPSSEIFTCPPTGWIDCMPGESAKPGCSADYVTWAEKNCPDFKGIAY